MFCAKFKSQDCILVSGLFHSGYLATANTNSSFYVQLPLETRLEFTLF